MQVKTPKNRSGRLALYCLATGLTGGFSIPSHGVVERMDLKDASFPITLKLGDSTQIYLNNETVPAYEFGNIISLNVTDGSSTTAHVRLDNADFNYGGTLFYSMPVTGLNSDHYLGLLSCDQRVDSSLKGLGGDGLSNSNAVAVFSPGYENIVGERGFMGLEIANRGDVSNTFQTRHFAYLEFEIVKVNDDPEFEITIYDGALETTPGKPIAAGELSGTCFPWEIFQPAINAGALEN
jgi:hypothetical protein